MKSLLEESYEYLTNNHNISNPALSTLSIVSTGEMVEIAIMDEEEENRYAEYIQEQDTSLYATLQTVRQEIINYVGVEGLVNRLEITPDDTSLQSGTIRINCLDKSVPPEVGTVFIPLIKKGIYSSNTSDQIDYFSLKSQLNQKTLEKPQKINWEKSISSLGEINSLKKSQVQPETIEITLYRFFRKYILFQINQDISYKQCYWFSYTVNNSLDRTIQLEFIIKVSFTENNLAETVKLSSLTTD